jgi:hypothetical protein
MPMLADADAFHVVCCNVRETFPGRLDPWLDLVKRGWAVARDDRGVFERWCPTCVTERAAERKSVGRMTVPR